MKYALLAALVCTMALMSCTDDDPVVGSSPTEEERAGDIGFTLMVLSVEEQAMIDEKLALITEYYADKEPDHFLILVGNKETLVDDMSCNSHDQAVVDRMLSGGNPSFLHLAPKEAIAEGALNQKYADAPDNIKEAIDYVNQFSSNVGALSDDVETGRIMFNFTNEELGIVQGNCQDLGVHHLGLFKDTEVVTAMNDAGYGVATWNGLPVYAGYNCNENWEDSYKNSSDCNTCKLCAVQNWDCGIGCVYSWYVRGDGNENCNADADIYDSSKLRNQNACANSP